MNIRLFIVTAFFLSGCHNVQNPAGEAKEGKRILVKEEKAVEKPKVSFTFDDGITDDILQYKFEDWNAMILAALKEEKVKAVFFVTGANKLDEKGKYLLNSWTQEGHKIGNHTFTHPWFNSEKLTVADFENELLQTDKVIAEYSSYVKLFRFPYLKEGNTEEKIKGFRAVLSKYGYRNGHVTIDASDWFVNGELIKSIRKHGLRNSNIEKYKTFYLQHILERADYYEKMAFELTNRHIHHTLLLHHNLASALFLGDLMKKFREAGWEIVDADLAFQDEIFQSTPNTIPAGESLIWATAKASGKYEGQLRYPAEDSKYEIPKMKKLGIEINN